MVRAMQGNAKWPNVGKESAREFVRGPVLSSQL